MTESRDDVNGSDDTFDELFADYVDRLVSGEVLDLKRIAGDHPDVAGDLVERLRVYGNLVQQGSAATPLGTLGDYTLRRQIGRGGMGVVYEAWQNSVDRHVALKVLPPGVAADERALQRFVREAKTAAQLHHPNVVGVHGMGVEQDTPYYAMEYVEGKTLAQVLADLRDAGENTPTPFGNRSDQSFYSNVARAFAGVADGLQHAHSNGVIHRDIKPSNLILDEECRLRILDFGLAHLEGQQSLTLSGDVLGTPLYMSPEQARRRKITVDHRTDIWSLGATMYELVTGRPPFAGKDGHDTLSSIIERDPIAPRAANPRVPTDLETLILKCLHKDPKDRFATAEALGQELRRVARGDPIETQPESGWERFGRKLRRHRAKLVVGSVTLVLVVACGLLAWRLAVEAGRGRQLLEEENERRIVAQAMKVLRGETTVLSRAGGDRTAGLLGGIFPGTWRVYVRESGQVAVEDALDELAQSVEDFPERFEGHYWRGRALRILREEHAAIAAFERALHHRPGFTPARAVRDELVGHAAAPVEGEAPWGGTWLAAWLAMRERHWTEAVEAWSELIALDEELRSRRERLWLGSLLEHLLLRGIGRLELGNFEGAKRDFVTARTVSRNDWGEFVEPALLLGKTYSLEGNTAEAEAIFGEVFARSTSKDDVALWIASVYRSLGENKAALAWAEHVTREPVGDRLRAELLSALRRTAEAVAAQQRVARHSPDDLGAQLALGRFLLDDIWQTTGGSMAEARGRAPAELEELTRVSERALALGPRSSEAYAFASAVARALGEPDRARVLSRHALALADGRARRGAVTQTTAESEGSTVMRTPLVAAGVAVFVAGVAGAQEPVNIAVNECVAGHFAEPEPLPSEINSFTHEWSPGLSEDRQELFFASERNGTFDLFVATPDGQGAFTIVNDLDELNTTDQNEGNPRLSRDGRRLYFATNPDGRGGEKVHVARREGPGERFAYLGELVEVNASFPDGVSPAAISGDEREIYLTVVDRAGTFDLAMAWRGPGDERFANTRLLDELNTPAFDENNATISADGLTLLWSNFGRNPPETARGDIWIATRPARFDTDGNPVRFSDKRRLPPPVSSHRADLVPFLTWDWPAPGSALYFALCEPPCNNVDVYRSAWVPVTPPPATVRRALHGLRQPESSCGDFGAGDVLTVELTVESVRETVEGCTERPDGIEIRDVPPRGWGVSAPGARVEDGVVIFKIEGDRLLPGTTVSYEVTAEFPWDLRTSFRGSVVEVIGGEPSSMAFPIEETQLVVDTPFDACGGIRCWNILGAFLQPGGGIPGEDAIRKDYLTDGSLTERDVTWWPGKAVRTDFDVAASTALWPCPIRNPDDVPTIFPASTNTDGIVDLDALLCGPDDCMAYAQVYVIAEERREDVYLGVSSDDSVEVLLNGEEVWINSVGRGLGNSTSCTPQDVSPDFINFHRPLVLEEGENNLLVKVFDGFRGFKLALRFQDELGEPITQGLTLRRSPVLCGEPALSAVRSIEKVGAVDTDATVSIEGVEVPAWSNDDEFRVGIEISKIRQASAGPPPCPATSAVTIREFIPAGWEARDPSDEGLVLEDDHGNEVVVWELEGEALSPRTLTYTLLAPGDGAGIVAVRGHIEDRTPRGAEISPSPVRGDLELANPAPLTEVGKFGEGGFITEWLLLGPFANSVGAAPSEEAMRKDFLSDGEVTENAVRPVAGDTIASLTPLEDPFGVNPDGVPTWKAWRDRDDSINLQQFYGGNVDFCMVYALTYFRVEEERELQLEIGSDDALQVLLDGEEVYITVVDSPFGDFCERSNDVRDSIPLGAVSPGIVHTLVVKVFEGSVGPNCFRLRLVDPAAFEPLTDYELCLHPECESPVRVAHIRGDCNNDGTVNISDPSYLLNWLFLGGPPLPCKAAGDANGDGGVDISDAISILNFLFLGGPAPDAPFPDCGPLAEDEALSCDMPPEACR